MKYRNFVLINAEIPMIIALIALACLILINSCGTRHEPRIKRIDVPEKINKMVEHKANQDTIIVNGNKYVRVK